MDLFTLTIGIVIGGGLKWQWDKYQQKKADQSLGKQLAQAQAEIQQLKVKAEK